MWWKCGDGIWATLCVLIGPQSVGWGHVDLGSSQDDACDEHDDNDFENDDDCDDEDGDNKDDDGDIFWDQASGCMSLIHRDDG